jgi:asparagine synthase (glutamine-hydrolysing)
MCGIIGQLNKFAEIAEDRFAYMRDTMRHRGPDGEGMVLLNKKRVALGHRRLAIIDLSDNGRQPMTNERDNVWLTFNGEIYNYRELRIQLINAGHVFRSHTDSEVLIHGYEEWGFKGLLDKITGMYAFAIYDCTIDSVFLARDRFGIKPLYYYNDAEHFIFASEIKGILAYQEISQEIDESAIRDFLVNRFIPSPKTIWKKIQKLAPGEMLTFSWAHGMKVDTYWELKENQGVVLSEKEVITRVDELLERAVRSHLESDVPIGLFLSGGYDSSALMMYLARLDYAARTYTIGFDGWEKSEHLFGREVARMFGTEHTEHIMGHEITDYVQDLMYYYDEPIGGNSFVPTFEVSRLAAKDRKVVLAGDGGDEGFAGYVWYSHLASLDLPQEQLLKKYSSYIGSGFTYQEANRLLRDRCASDTLPSESWIFEKYYDARLGKVKSLQLLDLKTFLPEIILTKVDRASMANSLEVRVPFLDHTLVEFLFSLPEDMYFKANTKKYILYNLLRNSFPAKILDKPKKGFSASATFYSLDKIKAALQESVLVDKGIFCADAISDLLSHAEHNREKVWTVYILECWARTWLVDNNKVGNRCSVTYAS